MQWDRSGNILWQENLRPDGFGYAQGQVRTLSLFGVKYICE